MLTEDQKATINSKVDEIKAIFLQAGSEGVVEVIEYAYGESEPLFRVESIRDANWTSSDCYEGSATTTWLGSNC